MYLHRPYSTRTKEPMTLIYPRRGMWGALSGGGGGAFRTIADMACGVGECTEIVFLWFIFSRVNMPPADRWKGWRVLQPNSGIPHKFNTLDPSLFGHGWRNRNGTYSNFMFTPPLPLLRHTPSWSCLLPPVISYKPSFFLTSAYGALFDGVRTPSLDLQFNALGEACRRETTAQGIINTDCSWKGAGNNVEVSVTFSTQKKPQ